jgi:hypothetical protein
MRPEDWVDLDRITGELHLSMATAHPEWARILEHTPGVCATQEEMIDDRIFHPEAQQWSLYSEPDSWYGQLRVFYAGRVWGERHEIYFLKRFLYYYSPYQHGIDPPINLGAYEYKYGLHSRIWHYFVPALQAALALVDRRTIRGKFDTLRGWLEHFPAEPILLKAAAMVEGHYESRELNDESALVQLECELFRFLERVMEIVKQRVTLIDMSSPTDVALYKSQLAALPTPPRVTIYDGVRFSRIRRGRYYFYLNCPAAFDAGRLIASEMKWLKGYFTEPLFKAYGMLRTGSAKLNLDEICGEMRGGLIDDRDEKLIRRMFALSFDAQSAGRERELITQAAQIYPDYHLILERILADSLART